MIKKISSIAFAFLTVTCATGFDLNKMPVIPISFFNSGYCSGVLLDESHLITARHCLPNNLSGIKRVALDRDNYFTKFKVLYNDKPKKSSARLNDGVAVIKLLEAVSFRHIKRYHKIGTHRKGPYLVYCFPVSLFNRRQYLYKRVATFGKSYTEGGRKYIAVNVGIAGGCSGGGLFNRDGDLIGVAHSGYGNPIRAGFFLDVVDYRKAIEKVLP